MNCIGPDLTVREVARTWPACARLLTRYPAAQWGGKWTLQELGSFARSNALDEQRLLNELSAAAGVPARARAKARPEHSPMPLVFAALFLGLTIGAGWGVWLLLRVGFNSDFGILPGLSVHLHGLGQLWGWLALFVFAVGAHLLRQSTKRPAAAWLDYAAVTAVAVGLLLFCGGLSETIRGAFRHINVIASAFLFCGAGCFAMSTGWSLWGRGKKPQLWYGFVLATVGWLLVWAVADLLLRMQFVGQPIISAAGRDLLIVLPVLGFAANAIYGFGIRLIPGLLNITRLRPWYFAAALVLHNAGLCAFLVPMDVLRIAGAGLMLAGAVLYVMGMNWLRSSPSRTIYGVDERGHLLVRVAFAWLVIGLAMVLGEQLFPWLPRAYGGAWRHALTVGFITTMILGVGHRLIPIFLRQPLASPPMMIASMVLIIVGNILRVGLQLATIGEWQWTYSLIGLSGVLELSALMLFSLNLALTARNRRRTHSVDQPLTPDVRVREAINARPELQQRLRELGVTMFDDAAFIAPSMTFGALALAWGQRPADLLENLAPAPAPADGVRNT
jgi:hypothetical protein